ncbi:MAG: S46 family peptidase [Bacteroidales bacterium]|nr:S46 family peptidase [Bacteroidales bacterium]
MKNIRRILASLFLTLAVSVMAGEGMWIPSLLKQLNEAEMKSLGFRLSAEDIYSINQSSMKDAVVLFGRGCTGEIVSAEGLLLTNHHCGLGQIQQHSSVEHDYLTHGFWAMNRGEELPSPGLSVTLLKRMEDVTQRILENVSPEMTEADRKHIIGENIKSVVEEATRDSHYEAEVRPFYYGNTWYLFVTEVFRDIRLVGAPPSAIGKFGGDTDNWMWPRHTGDFSVFRIYASQENKPATYSKENVPYQPEHHFPVSLAGYKEGDFTLVFGYPGSTEQFITSDAVKLTTEVHNPIAIEARRMRLDIFEKHMAGNDKVRIQYTTKHARIANGWKKWIGENRGIHRLKTVRDKEIQEAQFSDWAGSEPGLSASYGTLLPSLEAVYARYTPAMKQYTYVTEAGMASEVIRLSGRLSSLLGKAYDKKTEASTLQEDAAKLNQRLAAFYKDYDPDTDRDVMAATLKYYWDNMHEVHTPAYLRKLHQKFKGDFNAMSTYIFRKSKLTNPASMELVLKSGKRSSILALAKDPVVMISDGFAAYHDDQLLPVLEWSDRQLDSLYRLYVAALMSMTPDDRFYPDANLTLRVAYGQVDDYYPRDAVRYEYFTTLDGIMEKERMDVYDYVVPERLKVLYEAKDFGEYAAEDGQLYTCFTASNHTTGGNSGSPVLNADGHLIGINFDRNWEGTMSDIDYDPDQCRNISLDIRYCLFIIDKYAGASHLIEEMTVVK